MSVLYIDDEVRRAIARMVERARARPVPWELMRQCATDDPSFELPLDRRPPGLERPPSEHLRIGKYRVAFSFEEQPAGIFRHLSVSVPRAGKTPHPAAVGLLAQEFGFTE